MKKYWAIFKISWNNILVYRMNIFLWRVRMMLAFLAVYFFWGAVFSEYTLIANYTQMSMLAYLLVAFFLQYLVIGNDSYHICVEIANGDLNNYLLKPLSYFSSWLTRDWALKILNLCLSVFEIYFLVTILKLPFVWPPDFWQGILFLAVAVLAAIMYFFFSFLVSAFAFWYPEHDGWPLRFVMLTLLEFLSGRAFPLDIFPTWLYQLFRLLPFSYFTFFPAQIYLDKLSPVEVGQGLVIMVAWFLILVYLTKIVWRKGLQIYGAYGR